MTRKPLSQGDEDGFCGLYAIINALTLLFPSRMDGGCVKMQMRDRRMVGRLAVSDCRISTDLLRSMSF